jgi:hypothetical protein
MQRDEGACGILSEEEADVQEVDKGEDEKKEEEAQAPNAKRRCVRVCACVCV